MSDVKMGYPEVYYDPDEDNGQYMCGITQRNCYIQDEDGKECLDCQYYIEFNKWYDEERKKRERGGENDG